MKLLRTVFAFLCIVLLGCETQAAYQQIASAEPRAETETYRLLRGSILYHQNDCRKCHYSGARGGSIHGGPSLVDDEWLHCDGSVEGIRTVIIAGIPKQDVVDPVRVDSTGMASASEQGLSDEEVLTIAMYLHAIGNLDTYR